MEKHDILSEESNVRINLFEGMDVCGTPGNVELLIILDRVGRIRTGKLTDIRSSLGTAIRDFKQSVKETPEKHRRT